MPLRVFVLNVVAEVFIPPVLVAVEVLSVVSEVLSVVSGVRWRCEAGEKGKADRQRIPDTTTWTKPLEKAYGDWFPSCFVGRRWSGLLEDGAWRRAKAAAEMEGIKERVGRQIPTLV